MAVFDPLPPAFFPVGLNLVGRRCVVIGDDREAVEKEAALREAGAAVVRIRDSATVHDDDVSDAFFVISTPKDEALSRRLRALAERHRFLFCAIDQPAYGFVAMQAIVASGPARIAISTGGAAPRVGKALKEALQAALDATFARFIDCLATQRRRNRRRLGSISERREAMIRSAEGFTVEVRVRYPRWFEDELEAMRPIPAPAGSSTASGARTR
jgi:siroheme synthase (precorrin-2 oxidase/ferrochelatase)